MPGRRDEAKMRGMDGPRLTLVPGEYAVWKLDPAAAFPADPGGELFSVTRTRDELSVVASASAAPAAGPVERGWAALRVAGPLDFSLVGILAGLTAALADAGVSVFALSTHDTDWLLVKHTDLERAAAALRSGGHEVDLSHTRT